MTRPNDSSQLSKAAFNAGYQRLAHLEIQAYQPRSVPTSTYFVPGIATLSPLLSGLDNTSMSEYRRVVSVLETCLISKFVEDLRLFNRLQIQAPSEIDYSEQPDVATRVDYQNLAEAILFIPSVKEVGYLTRLFKSLRFTGETVGLYENSLSPPICVLTDSVADLIQFIKLCNVNVESVFTSFDENTNIAVHDAVLEPEDYLNLSPLINNAGWCMSLERRFAVLPP
ncbi:hypothetical protein GJ496_007150 [Pomphorhynchus laevis]|nr:hypothetical protein GJ496_007150 [Pomphorhynchus laevis]